MAEGLVPFKLSCNHIGITDCLFNGRYVLYKSYLRLWLSTVILWHLDNLGFYIMFLHVQSLQPRVLSDVNSL